MDQEKIYRRDKIKLADFIKEIGLPSVKVSCILNHHLKTKFYDIINEYRIKEAKERLLNMDKETENIAQIGYELGFSSQTLFGRKFKKATGMTPKQFIKNNNY